MKEQTEKFYLVKKTALPEIFQKVMQVKEGIRKKQYPSVNRAVKELGLSRSAYYKYRNAIFSYHGSDFEAVDVFNLVIEIDLISSLAILQFLEDHQAELINFQQTPATKGLSNLLIICRKLSASRSKLIVDHLNKENGIVRINHQAIRG